LTRLSLIDGLGLAPRVQGEIDQLKAAVAGLKKTLGNVKLRYKTTEAQMKQDITLIKATLNSLLGTTL
jgi:hypothetical protein